MHNLRNNTHIQEALQPYKTKTQLVAVGGCGQAFTTTTSISYPSAFAKVFLAFLITPAITCDSL